MLLHTRVYILCVVLASIVARSYAVCLSDSIFSEAESSIVDLDQVVVTATRTPKLLSEAPVQTKLISAGEIMRLDAVNIEDILKQELPGVEFSYSMNMQVNMNMAGFAGQSVLFLVDGERMAGETNDNVDFERLLSSDVARIEIVKGAVSALYGSSANGGVINIISKNPLAQPSFRVNVRSRFGSHGEGRYGFDLGLHRHQIANSLSVDYSSTDCFGLNNHGQEPIPLRIDYVPGQSVLNVMDRFVWSVTDDLRLTARAGYYMRQMVRNREEAEHSRYYDYSAGVRADYDPSDFDHIELNYSFDQYDKTRFYVPSALSVSGLNVREYSNVQNSVRMLWSHQFTNSELTAGADYLYDYLINQKLAGADFSQMSADAFVQYDVKLSPQFEVVGALRYDYLSHNNTSQITPKLSAIWHLGNLSLRGGYGKGFRTPSLKELYYDFEAMTGWIIDGNQNLKPECSHNFSLSADYSCSHYNFTLIGYYNHITDRITTGVPQTLSGSAHLPYVNLSSLDVSGTEASVQSRWNNGLGAKLSYCYTYEHNPYQAPNQFMPARPHSCNYRIDYDHSFDRNLSMTIALSGRWLSSVRNREYLSAQHPEQGIMTVHYPSYSMHKLQLSCRWSYWLSLSFAVDNLFDYIPENYYYNSPLTTGRTYSASLSLSF